MSSLPKAVLVMSVIGLTFLPRGSVFSNCSRCSLLNTARPERFPRVSLKVSLTFPLLSRRNLFYRFRFLMPVAPDASSRTSILTGFLVQYCPCLVPDAVQKWHGESSLCGRRPNSSVTHHRPGSVSSADPGALRLDARLHIGPPAL
jgi:hypothetical protein